MQKLSSFSELSFGVERTLLPSVSEATRSRYIAFPTSSDQLKPYAVLPLVIDVPRFSIFSFERLNLAGFRLFSASSSMFTDQSLVDETDQASSIFFQKRENGQLEDVVFDAGYPRSRGPQNADLDLDGIIALCSDEPSNFGSWIYRILPKFMLSYEATGFNKVFVYQNSKWMLPILKAVCPYVEVQPHWPEVTYKITNATIPSLPAPGVWFRQEIHDRFSDLMDKVTNSQKDLKSLPSEKLYISRRKQAIARPSFRVLENETELAERLIARGFSEFFPEDYGFEDQINIVSRAKVIVSVGGSNLFGCIFARSAEIIIDLESSFEWIYAHTNLLASTRRPFSIVTGMKTDTGGKIHGNWVIDVSALLRGMQTLGVL